MGIEDPNSNSGGSLYRTARFAYPALMILGVGCLLLALASAGTPAENPPGSSGWYYFAAAGTVFLIVGAWFWRFSPQRERKRRARLEAEEEKLQAEKEQHENLEAYNRWFWAFRQGTISEYPTFESTRYGLIMRSGEVCYLIAEGAILGRGNAHQLEISEGSNAGIELRGLRIGGNRGRRDSYSTIEYDESHPGNLFITSQRITFVSPPSVFLEVAPSQIVTAAWNGRYVMLRTTMTSDENQNLLAFSLRNPIPAWVYAAAMLRLAQDDVGGGAGLAHSGS